MALSINADVIDNLRAAAHKDEEVFNLLATLADCFPSFEHGSMAFKACDEDRAYLKSAVLAAEFAKSDHANSRGDS